MRQSTDAYFKQVMEGSDRSIAAEALRIAASCAEPVYAAIMRLRNGLYDAKILPIHRLGRPTISVGNITTGGTGKTPMVRWLAASLTDERPCVLLRGYKSTAAGLSDEQALLAAGAVPVIADGERRRGAAGALERHPETTVFILDDGMQHRRVARDFEIVLIHAREPFGGGRMFPRGMLREPLPGLRRADAFVVTHADEVDATEMARISGVIRKHNQPAAIFRADHVIQGLRSAAGESMPIQSLEGKRYFAFCGLGSPASFFWRMGTVGGVCVGTREFGDHFDYRERDVAEIIDEAASAGAELLVVTEKDWVKLSRVSGRISMPVWRAELSLRFWAGEGEKLLEMIGKALRNRTRSPSGRG
ncbi:MAG: tetraacyldisaccharide 4'-kinase [Tepidisphaeraceae bacterium]